MPSYTVAEAKNNLPKLIDKAMAGEEVAITRRGKTVVRMVSNTPKPMSIDREWLERVRVTPTGPATDFTDIVRKMRDEDRY